MFDNERENEYVIRLDNVVNPERSRQVLIAGRRCYSHQQSDTDESVMSAKPSDLIRDIVGHCSKEDDYLLPDTPLKEALFRVMLASGNRAMTPSEIGAGLSAHWGPGAFARNVTTQVIARILDNAQFYCVHRAAA